MIRRFCGDDAAAAAEGDHEYAVLPFCTCQITYNRIATILFCHIDILGFCRPSVSFRNLFAVNAASCRLRSRANFLMAPLDGSPWVEATCVWNLDMCSPFWIFAANYFRTFFKDGLGLFGTDIDSLECTPCKWRIKILLDTMCGFNLIKQPSCGFQALENKYITILGSRGVFILLYSYCLQVSYFCEKSSKEPLRGGIKRALLLQGRSDRR